MTGTDRSIARSVAVSVCVSLVTACGGGGGSSGGGGPPPPPPPAANAPPTAALALYQDGGHGPLTVSVDGGASEDPEGGALTYRWNFGDQHQAQGVAASHTYPEQGTYVLSLTVADLQGASNTINQNVSVKREELVCNAEN